MNMRTFSAQTGLSAHTIRYYEKLGLLPGIQRNASGHRAFTTQDLEWVRFIVRLKDTGMSLDDILTYSRLRALGSTTLASRQKMLEQHRDALRARIENEQLHLVALEAKIQHYQSLKPA
ncbi:MerR family transcriptional regulator [Pseudomonas neustonica]|uniref:MerR family transcriptional regulator n=1 Tax=Pseudomonas neustonica TaxID=2487346 RepID=A0ABX9XGZ2_9PSED|nr:MULTISPECIES: MerR family transcriptional regulator [Pseudomonas]ROZ82238.1 MerR family transcriptional regulator [Pseudomonas sp. SSM44]ROZ84030.1 MerR family transcriptional regulator [Pseudomonas neustonica]|tara:strand:+ start:24 stop:380 length:357 start_codon:yes stop_codon:yes gene_type:complete